MRDCKYTPYLNVGWSATDPGYALCFPLHGDTTQNVVPNTFMFASVQKENLLTPS